jgi:hypothetical protein
MIKNQGNSKFQASRSSAGRFHDYMFLVAVCLPAKALRTGGPHLAPI